MEHYEQQETHATAASAQWHPIVEAPAPPAFTAVDGVAAIASFPVAFLLARSLPKASHPLGTLLVTLLILGLGAVYLILRGKPLTGRAWCLMGIASIFSVSYFTSGNAWVLFFVGLLITILYCAAAYESCGLSSRRADRLLRELGDCAVRLPLKRLGAVFGAVKGLGGQNGLARRLGKSVKYVGIGLLAALIPTALVWGLLSYDEGFNRLMRSLLPDSTDGWGAIILDLILTVPLAMALFAGVFASVDRSEREPSCEDRGRRELPLLLLCTAVTPLLLIYVVFFISQADYYLSAFTHTLPDGLTYAAYAREGFFQLCAVCTVNAVLLLLFCMLARKGANGERHPVTGVYALVISLFTLILIATALSKMLLYIDSYGLTQKRVYTSWFMLLLAVGFLSVAVKQVVRRAPAAAAALAIALLLCGAVALPNVDAIIANYNVSAYLEQKLPTVDVASLNDLGESAVPAKVRLESALLEKEARTDAEEVLLREVSDALDQDAEELEERGFFAASLPRLRAEASLNKRK